LLIVLTKFNNRDPRQPSIPIRTHTSTHSDDITTVSFLPRGRRHGGTSSSDSSRSIVLSGSTDGLLCTSYADENDEDEAIIHVGNCGSSISQAGWIDDGDGFSTPGHAAAAVWAATDMETFGTWTGDVRLTFFFWFEKSDFFPVESTHER